MVKVQFKDGQTITFDLNQEQDGNAWERFRSGDGWSSNITALGVHCRKTLHTLPVPNSGLSAYGFGAGLITGKPNEKILGESVWYCVNDVKVALNVYGTNQKVTKVVVTQLPKQEN